MNNAARTRINWRFFFVHMAAFLVALPVVAASRLLFRRQHNRHESVFGETNRSVLTALGFALAA